MVPRLNEQLLREVIGDDDPRTYESDESFVEMLAGKTDDEHVEITVYAGTLRRILTVLRGPKWNESACRVIYQPKGAVLSGDTPTEQTLPSRICMREKDHDGLHAGTRVVHLDTGSEAACQADEEDLEASVYFDKVNCPACLELASHAACLDCGLPYQDFPLDVLLPRSQWLEIHESDGGLLCAQCIAVRVAARIKGSTCIHAIVEVTPHRSLPPAVKPD